MFFSGEDVDPDSIPPIPSQTPEGRQYTDAEKALRDLFVIEYLVDYDPVKAAMRCNFGGQFAIEYSKKFMAEPYVQQRISQLGTSADVDPEELSSFNRRRIREQLTREAFYYGPGSSHAARVAALKALSDIEGMTPKGGARGVAGKGGAAAGGVMQVPAIADIDAWEAAASESQDTLIKDATEDRQ